ncbi:MAG: hydrogenase expression/formation protein HypE [Candidatus Eisenbacteria bacterium]|nr:hydrogenase expression/formation protein HypE [Candidatus Eisenbacteria bacterium]
MHPSRPPEILLAHGSGGRLTHELVRSLFVRLLDNPALSPLEDAACLAVGASRIAFTTDSFVVSPVFFPGGDLGKLAVCGTVNDLAVMGARPIALSAGFLLEEGLSIERLERLVLSMRGVCDEVGVAIVTGDTKVVERGGLDQVFVNTAGVGLLDGPLPEGAGAVRPGDRILVSGPIADHGMAVLSARNDLRFDTPIESDCAPLWPVIEHLLEGSRGIRWMRDPTRGGVATTLNELVAGRPFGIELVETEIPIRPSVAALAEILGIDPLYVACEGRVLIAVAAEHADAALVRLREHRLGLGSESIGEVLADPPGRLTLRTRGGGRRVLDLLSGEQLPRIC